MIIKSVGVWECLRRDCPESRHVHASSPLLQIPHTKEKKADQIDCLKRRLMLWKKGDIDDLLHEGNTIQSRIQIRHTKDKDQDQSSARKFARKMQQGNVKAAIRLITDDN